MLFKLRHNFTLYQYILNPNGFRNHIIGSELTTMYSGAVSNERILSSGGVGTGKVYYQRGYPIQFIGRWCVYILDLFVLAAISHQVLVLFKKKIFSFLCLRSCCWNWQTFAGSQSQANGNWPKEIGTSQREANDFLEML